MAKKMEEINDLNIDSLALNAEGLKLYENKKEFIEIVKKQIENIEIRDVDIEIIENALKLVQTSALERMRKAAEGDINKSDTRNILDRLHRVKNLHGDERIKEISNIIVLSPIYLIEAIVSILAIGIRHLIEGAPKMGEKIGKEAVHYAKNIADTAQFWKDGQFDKFLRNIDDRGKDYRDFSSSQRYIVPDEQKTFAMAYRDNPQILDIIQEKMGDNGYLTVNAGDERVDITKSDCKKFKEKALSKRSDDTDKFHALLEGLSNIVKDADLWKEIQDKAAGESKVEQPYSSMAINDFGVQKLTDSQEVGGTTPVGRGK